MASTRYYAARASPEISVINDKDNRNKILSSQVESENVQVGFFGLYRYATVSDKLLLLLSVICCVIAGAAVPGMTIVLGGLTGKIRDFVAGTVTAQQFRDDVSRYSLYFVYVGIGEFVTVFIGTAGFVYVGERVTSKIRERYMQAILRQNIGFFDQLGPGEIANRITVDTHLVQTAVSEKVGTALTSIGTFVTALAISLGYSWRLALISCSSVVAIVLLMGSVSRFIVKFNQRAQEEFDRAISLAEEAIGYIRIVSSLNARAQLSDRFESHLDESEKWGRKVKVLLGVSIGGLICIVMLNIGLDFWEGSRLLVNSQITEGEILTITLSIVIGAFSLGYVAPNMQHIAAGIAAAAKIFGTIDRESPIDPLHEGGDILQSLTGEINFAKITHVYPSRPDTVALKHVSLHIPAGKTIALVGASGSGKSTFINILQRFYTPLAGEITVDGHDITTLDLSWLRQQMSLVGQQPTLFSTTIYENIAHGLIGSANEHAPRETKEQLVMEAAKIANAHYFIQGLPDGYDTWVGERGSQLSGGQKQRISIARAVIRNPKILLLDEATSALDSNSERLVQEALDRAAEGRTTIMVAHRLSTVRRADQIVVLDHGRIVEQGSHEKLIERQGTYYRLYEAQTIRQNIIEGHCPTSPVSFITDDAQSRYTFGSLSDVRLLPMKIDDDEKFPETTPLHEKTKPPTVWSLVRMVTNLNRPEVKLMALGLFCSVLAGGGTPTHVVFLAKNVEALATPPSQYAQMRHDVNFWSVLYVALGFAMLLAQGTQGYALGFCSERLLRRARLTAFQSMLKQKMKFFDQKENSTGSLISFLSMQTVNLVGLSGSTLGTILTGGTTLIAAISVSIAFGWKLGLVCVAMIPILLACGFLRFYLLARYESKSKALYEKSAGYACEAVTDVRTVAALTREREICNEYRHQVEQIVSRNLGSVMTTSSLYACSQSLFFGVTALSFWYGGNLIADGEYTLFQLFVCFIEIMFATQSVGTIFSFAPDMARAKEAASNLKNLYEQQPEVSGHKPLRSDDVKGRISLQNVSFRYPTRQSKYALRNVSITIETGQHVALVGSSGSGKSTIIALLEQFYQVERGSITLDGKDIRDFHLADYRAVFGLVSQEPTMLRGTIRENLVLGMEQGIDEETVVKACKDANIYEFIESLSDGMNTLVGSKGVLLSGGQKQRIAIARILIRNPKILLLDEATSALDSESAALVQQALDKVCKGRTCISVAHQLSTIQNADQIYVLHEGSVVELGTHEELIRRPGIYAELARLQDLGV
ncbi:P-loop containing nucleoside triphosphate hydrolase protein [Aspergillus cavernicola]|uniref:P-loop containing nucleoside triphosphate hydrolase protein n=1 Tax=Aspergillus cavernicola TaxID=176166 RepID=A0ABR4IUH1_9EURO